MYSIIFMETKMNNILPRVLLASSFIMLTLFWPGAEADLAELEGWSWRRQLQQWPVILTLTHKYKYTVDDVFWMYSNMELGNGNNKKIQQILGSTFWNTSLAENNSEGEILSLWNSTLGLKSGDWRHVQYYQIKELCTYEIVSYIMMM